MRRFIIAVQLLVACIFAGVLLATAPAVRDAAASSAHVRAARVTHRLTCRWARAHLPRTSRQRRALCHRIRASRDTAHAASGGLIVGLNANVSGWGGASTADRLERVIAQTDTRWLRENFVWSTIEPQPGVFDFSYYDHFMLIAARHGEHVLALLYGTPAWAGPSESAIPADPADYAAYVAAVVNRYGPHGSFWGTHPDLARSAIQVVELWNEPFGSSYDNGVYDPGRYARLVRAAGAAAHAADPSVNVLMASEMQTARDANGNWQWWTDAMYQAVPDLNNYFDGVAMHDYGNDTRTLRPIVPGQPYPNYGRTMRIENLRHQFVAHGAADKPFWITEIGWSTCNDSPDCVSPAQQEDNLATFLNDARGMWSNWVQAVFVYHYTDGPDPSNVQDAYGLTNYNGTPKPALRVFRIAAQVSPRLARDRRQGR
jgi:hypothetical protein